MTLKDIYEKHGAGTKLMCVEDKEIYHIIGKCINNVDIVLESQDGLRISDGRTQYTYELYTEPKPKITRWLWVDKYSHKLSVSFYCDNELPSDNWVKLEWSAVVFDD